MNRRILLQATARAGGDLNPIVALAIALRDELQAVRFEILAGVGIVDAMQVARSGVAGAGSWVPIEEVLALGSTPSPVPLPMK